MREDLKDFSDKLDDVWLELSSRFEDNELPNQRPKEYFEQYLDRLSNSEVLRLFFGLL